MNIKIFATVHSLMNDIHLIEYCQGHLPMQYASNIEIIRQKWRDSETHLSRTCKTSFMLAP